MSKKSSSTRSEGSISQPMPAKKPSTRNRKEHQAIDKKSVRFSKESEQVQIRRPSRRSLLARWYSVEDYQSFQHTTYRDATMQSTVYLAAREADALLPKDEVAKCVGIVHLLSEDVRRESFSCVHWFDWMCTFFDLISNILTSCSLLRMLFQINRSLPRLQARQVEAFSYRFARARTSERAWWCKYQAAS